MLRGIIRSCVNMLHSKKPELQRLAAERLTSMMWVESVANQMVEEGCAEGLVDLLKEDSTPGGATRA
jgi:hypothetical protein